MCNLALRRPLQPNLLQSPHLPSPHPLPPTNPRLLPPVVRSSPDCSIPFLSHLSSSSLNSIQPSPTRLRNPNGSRRRPRPRSLASHHRRDRPRLFRARKGNGNLGCWALDEFGVTSSLGGGGGSGEPRVEGHEDVEGVERADRAGYGAGRRRIGSRDQVRSSPSRCPNALEVRSRLGRHESKNGRRQLQTSSSSLRTLETRRRRRWRYRRLLRTLSHSHRAGQIPQTTRVRLLRFSDSRLPSVHARRDRRSSPPRLPSFLLTGRVGDTDPWEGWNWMAPIKHKLVHFSGKEIKGMWEEAVAGGGDASQGISKLDALLSHLWSLVIRARGQEDSDEIVHLNLSIGARPRLLPPLPDDFLGSPLFILPVSLSARQVALPSFSCLTSSPNLSPLPLLSSAIRSTLASVTPPRLASLLHVLGTCPNPARHWDAFLGSKHTIVTSWLRIGMYEVDFGGGKPRLADSLMPNMDSIVQVAEFGAEEGGGGGGGGGSWWKGGVSVSLHLMAEVMKKLEADEGLRRSR